MKLVTFETRSTPAPGRRLGALSAEDKRVVDLNAAFAAYVGEKASAGRAREIADASVPTDMLRFLETGPYAIECARIALEYAERQAGRRTRGADSLVYNRQRVRLLAPLPRPRTIRDFMTFEVHAGTAAQPPAAWYEFPVYYKGNPESVIGPEDEIPWPSYSERLDYELEMGMYIGREGRDIPKERARNYIAGFTIFNDVSARDIQFKEMSVMLGPAKGKDFCNIMGPCLVTPDELDDMDLRMTARINGEVWSEGNSGTRRYTWEDMIAWASRDETLHPGEFFGSGTVGKGCGLELNRWIKPGDVVELEIEGIGVLRNPVGGPRRRHQEKRK